MRLGLSELGFGPSSHVSALRWVSRIFRKPGSVQQATVGWQRWRIARLFLILMVQTMPYALLLVIPSRWLLFEVWRFPVSRSRSFDSLADHVSTMGGAMVIGGALGLAIGMILCRLLGRAEGIAIGMAFILLAETVFSAVGGLASGIPVGFPIGFGLAFVMGIAFSVVENLKGGSIEGLGVGVAVGCTLMLAEGFVVGMSLLIGWQVGFVLAYFRPFNLPLHFRLLWPEPKPERYAQHPVVWDDCCQLEYPGLHRLLVAQAEREGEQEIDRLITEYSAQRPQAVYAKTVLLARQSKRLKDLSRIDDLLAKLPAGSKGYLAQTRELRERAREITRLQIRISTLDRPFLAEPFAELLVKTVDQFIGQIAGFEEPLATEFRRAAAAWKSVAETQQQRIRDASKTQTRQVFRAGDPVNRDNEAYLFRGGPVGEIERQVLLQRGCPGLIIYGRRRMGKSTLIRNIAGFLPSSITVLSVSMQAARAFDSMAAFVTFLGERLLAAFEEVDYEPINLIGLEHLLEQVDQHLESRGDRLLLAIDEYEMLDEKIGQGVFPEDLLAAIRESIQNHRHITWAFVGSHRIDELLHAPWASYLVSARTIEVEPFTPQETHMLLTQPMKHSSLWKDDERGRPQFPAAFWGTGGVERIHRETGGWPHLVQLVAETLVDQVNDAGVEQVTDPLIESALNKAVRIGDTVFHQLLNGESTIAGEWSFLQGFGLSPVQPPPEDLEILRSLKRRRLIVAASDGFRLQAPIMGNWLALRG